jgi:tetratricopeptide (TPR) repeat protein
MKGDRLCQKCGQVVPFGQVECPICSSSHHFLFWRLEPESLLLASLVALAILFVITSFVVRSYDAQERALATRWREQGQAALRAHHPREAVADFHNALNYSRGNNLDLLNLARALMQEGHLDEAQAYLRTLWAREPGDGEVNLELAHVSEMRGNAERAIGYYHDAIYGVWVTDAIVHRREVRLELIRLLLHHGMMAHADSELITLAGGLPQDSPVHLQAGQMFLQVQDYRRALAEFQHALRLDRHPTLAWAGAGEAAFHLGRYSEADHYLERAVAEHSADPQQTQELAVSRAILSSDPYEPRLPERVRVRRALLAFDRALARVKECAQSSGENLSARGSPDPLQAAEAQLLKVKPNALEWKLMRQPDLLVPLMDAVSAAERAATRQCGPGTALDQALVLITSQRGVLRD